jgi:hypothetical protein
VTQTIFGGAKVRIVRKHDKIRRVLSLIVLIAIVVLAWLGWVAFQRTASSQNADSLPYLSSAKEKLGVPNSPVENIASPVKAATVTLPSSEISNLAASRKSETQQPPVLKNSGQIVAKPAVLQPLKTTGASAVTSATSGNIIKPPAANPSVTHPIPKRPVATVLAAPRVTQTAASSPLAVSSNKVSSNPAPVAGASHPADTVNSNR